MLRWASSLSISDYVDWDEVKEMTAVVVKFVELVITKCGKLQHEIEISIFDWLQAGFPEVKDLAKSDNFGDECDKDQPKSIENSTKPEIQETLTKQPTSPAFVNKEKKIEVFVIDTNENLESEKKKSQSFLCPCPTPW